MTNKKLDQLKLAGDLAHLTASLRVEAAVAAANVLFYPTEETRREYQLKTAEVHLVLSEWRELLDEMESNK
jgi:hypothetical protein